MTQKSYSYRNMLFNICRTHSYRKMRSSCSFRYKLFIQWDKSFWICYVQLIPIKWIHVLKGISSIYNFNPNQFPEFLEISPKLVELLKIFKICQIFLNCRNFKKRFQNCFIHLHTIWNKYSQSRTEQNFSLVFVKTVNSNFVFLSILILKNNFVWLHKGSMWKIFISLTFVWNQSVCLFEVNLQ